ncbi:MAG TPA: 4-hydroxy-3-methylbut-2-enyl diphosphate reductase [Chitinophagaceae bacterium]|nr:4-hydroxy-3-methylbut-2-enyl diphosphate reductase [Chitinophagaceae bacterium]
MKQFNVPGKYRSPLIAAVKNKRKQQDKLKKDLSPTLLDFGPIQFYLARHFGFCYGVENAIEKAFTTIDENPGRRIFLLSEMIHNPQVNRDLQQRGVRFLQDTSGKQLVPFDELTPEDIAIIPAFGTTLEIESQLTNRGIPIEQYNTTCPFVEKVWNRSEQIAKSDYTIVIHGKPKHEETRATFSHASSHAASVIVNDMEDAVKLSRYITGEAQPGNFFEDLAGRYSPGFDPKVHLQRIGVVNQTTQLASETQAIADFLKQVMMSHYGLTELNIEERFADTRDTLCYATNDNQSAVINLLNTPADLSIVVGGYNSSNTTHLVELCEEKLPCFFISSEEKIISFTEIMHYNWHAKLEGTTHYYLPAKQPVKILLTSGASCPDAVVEAVIRKLVCYYPGARTVEEVAESFL